MPDNRTAACLIAEMMEADGWSPRRSLSDHPILGPIMDRRTKRYMELRSMTDFTSARMAADTEAVQEIIDAQQSADEIEKLRALVTRLTNVADGLASDHPDPGSEAMSAIYCGRHFIYD